MMRHSSRQRYGLALSLFVVASLMPAGPVCAKETVALTFGWPSGLHGRVTFSARTTRTVNGQSDNLNMAGRYDFVTSAAPDGLLIQFDNVETEVENAGSGRPAMVKAYMARAMSLPPSYVVGPDGQFVRIEGLEAFRNGIFEGLEDAFADVPAAAREQVIRTMDAIFTREQLEASLASEWDSHVGTWIGAEMDEGDLYELTFRQPMPAFGNMEVPMRSTFLLKGRVPCNGAETAKRCVELEAHTFVDPAGLAAAIEAFMARLPAGQEAPRVQDLQQETVVRLISEPDTLLPYLMETSTRTITTMAVGGESQASSRVEEKRFVYTY
jgi:hypothetical protein